MSLAFNTSLQSPDELRIAMLADIHFSDKPDWRVRFPGEAYSPQKRFELVWEGLAAQDPDLVMCPGDLVDRGDVSSYQTLDKLIFQSGFRDNFYCTPGNHDRTEELVDSIALGQRDEYSVEQGKLNYVVRRGPHHLIFLDSRTEAWNVGNVGDASREWLKSVLQQVPKDEFAWLVTHYPTIAFSPFLPQAAVMTDGSEVHDLLSIYKERVGAGFYGHVHKHHFHREDGIEYNSICPGSVALHCIVKGMPAVDPEGIIGFEILILRADGSYSIEPHAIDISKSLIL